MTSSWPEVFFFLSLLALCVDQGSQRSIVHVFLPPSYIVAYKDNQSGRIGWLAFADDSCMRTVQIIMR